MRLRPLLRRRRPDRLARRLAQLYAGLVLYGASMAMLIEAGLGLDPWDVFHQGVALRTGWTFGTVTIVVGALVLLLWIPLRQRPGVGTVSNVIVIGVAIVWLFADALFGELGGVGAALSDGADEAVVWLRGLGARRFTSLLRAGTKKLAMIVITAKPKPSNATGAMPRPARPTSRRAAS